jgi:integrase
MAYLIDGHSTPTIVNSSVARTREYLTGKEVEKLMEAARKSSRYGHRDATMILIAYRHGLRASEVCDLQWHQDQFRAATCPPDQARDAERSSSPRRRTARGASSSARAAARSVCVCLRAWRADCAEELSYADFAPRGARPYGLPYSPAHATSRLRLCAGERRPRYPGHPSLDGTQEYPAYSPLYGACARSVQGFLAGLTFESGGPSAIVFA